MGMRCRHVRMIETRDCAGTGRTLRSGGRGEPERAACAVMIRSEILMTLRGDRSRAAHRAPDGVAGGAVAVANMRADVALDGNSLSSGDSLSSSERARRFLRALNAQDLAGIAGQLAPDTLLVDLAGVTYHGQLSVVSAWRAAFAANDAMRIDADLLICRGPFVAIRGWLAGGGAATGDPTAPLDRRVPLACHAVVSESGIAEWRLYGDPAPLAHRVAASRSA
jgi:hypothetical protein